MNNIRRNHATILGSEYRIQQVEKKGEGRGKDGRWTGKGWEKDRGRTGAGRGKDGGRTGEGR